MPSALNSYTAPPLLRAGDVVRVVAPSGAFDRAAFGAGVEVLERKGLIPRFDEGLFAKHRYLAGTDERRLGELEAALMDPEARAVWFARGGYGATRIAPRVDPEIVAAHPRWLIGFSDATVLHACWQRASLVSMHGPNLTTLAGWGADARRDLWGMLFAGEAATLQGQWIAQAQAVSGPLVGGNLTVLSAMVGTGLLPSMAGAVVLLEDVGERPYRLDRSLTQLCQAGVFDDVAAFAIGQLTDCVDPNGDAPGGGAIEVIADVLAALGRPLLGGLAVGHEPSSFALPLGGMARVDEAGRMTVSSSGAVA